MIIVYLADVVVGLIGGLLSLLPVISIPAINVTGLTAVIQNALNTAAAFIPVGEFWQVLLFVIGFLVTGSLVLWVVDLFSRFVSRG